jgi:hypothetical protein
MAGFITEMERVYFAVRTLSWIIIQANFHVQSQQCISHNLTFFISQHYYRLPTCLYKDEQALTENLLLQPPPPSTLFKGLTMAQRFSRRHLNVATRVRLLVSLWDLWWAKWLWECFFPHHCHCTHSVSYSSSSTERQSTRRLGTLKEQCYFENRGALGRKYFHCNYVTNTTNLIHFTFTVTLLRFKVSTCFGHYLPIIRRHYMNAALVTVVCSCRCGLVSDSGRLFCPNPETNPHLQPHIVVTKAAFV